MLPNGLTLFRKPIETVVVRGTEVSLLCAGDGTEVIRHKLETGTRWGMSTQEGWTAFESLVVLGGELALLTANGEEVLRSGDVISASPVLADALFVARQETEFLYITSQPVFHWYSQTARDLMNLAVAVEEKDGYTADHCARIKALSESIGERMGLSPSEMLHLNVGAFLHDVGKVQVPLEVLNKPAKLTDEEWLIMKQHAELGAGMLRASNLPFLASVAPIVHYHHERWDGNGYYGLQRDEIPIGACIVAVADSFDAMTTDRVYQKARTRAQALEEIIRCKGQMYRPEVVEAFIDVFPLLDREVSR